LSKKSCHWQINYLALYLVSPFIFFESSDVKVKESNLQEIKSNLIENSLTSRMVLSNLQIISLNVTIFFLMMRNKMSNLILKLSKLKIKPATLILLILSLHFCLSYLQKKTAEYGTFPGISRIIFLASIPYQGSGPGFKSIGTGVRR
jgi:hypothetical protein